MSMKSQGRGNKSRERIRQELIARTSLKDLNQIKIQKHWCKETVKTIIDMKGCMLDKRDGIS